MSYCRWSEGDLYAYNGGSAFVVYVAANRVTDQVKASYEEPTAAALLARILWLGSKGCDYPWDTYRWLMEDIIAEVEASEAHDQQTIE